MKVLPYIVIIGLLIVIFLQRECSTPHEIPDCDTVVMIDTIIDSIPYPVKEYVPKITYKDTGSTKIVIDTVWAIKEYLTNNYYQDTILFDSNGLIVVMDTIYQNKIKWRENQIKLYPHTIKQTLYITEQPKLRNKVFIGFGVNGWTDKFGVSGNVGLVTKRDNLYTIGYDPINKSVGVGMYWKIRIKK